MLLHVLHVLLLGQFISLIVTSTGVFSQLLQRGGPTVDEYFIGFSVPAFQNFNAYFVIFCVNLVIWLTYNVRANHQNDTIKTSNDSQRGGRFVKFEEKLKFGVFKVPITRYMLVAATDVAGNTLLVTAYAFTDITSVTILSVCTLPFCVILSYFILHMRYVLYNYIGIIFCILGVVTAVVSDFLDLSGSGISKKGNNPLLGDALVVLGSICYAFTNVCQEWLVKDYDRTEYLFVMAAFGLIFSGIIVLSSELDILSNIGWNSHIVGYFLGYALALALMYIVVSKYLQVFDATLFNLSLLSSNVWAMLFGLVLFQVTLNVYYFIAFGMIALGIIIYSFSFPKRLISRNLSREENSVIEIESM